MITSTRIRKNYSHTDILVSRDDGENVRIGFWRGCLRGGDNGIIVSTKAKRHGITWCVERWFASNIDTPGDGWWRWADVKTRTWYEGGDDGQLSDWEPEDWEALRTWADTTVVPAMRAVYEEVVTRQVAEQARKHALTELSQSLAEDVNRERRVLEDKVKLLTQWCTELAEMSK